MDIKAVLGHLFNGVIVNKEEKHDYSKKINFNSLSDLFITSAKSKKDLDESTEYYIDLGGCIEIKVKVSRYKFKVRCNKYTRIYEITEKLSSYIPTIDKYCKFHNIKGTYPGYDISSIEELNIINGDRLIYEDSKGIAGGDEFYIDDDFLDPSYDYDFRGINDGEQKFYRGGLEYRRPCGWKRYALKVKGKFENDLWLGDTGKSNNDSEWAVVMMEPNNNL